MNENKSKKFIYSTSKITLVDYKIESLKELKKITVEGQTTDLDTRYFRLKQKKD